MTENEKQECGHPLNYCHGCDSEPCKCDETEPLSYYTTCTNCDEEKVTETILEGVGEYHRESNTLFLLPCIACGYEMEVSGWLDECEDCGELHYESEGCPE